MKTRSSGVRSLDEALVKMFGQGTRFQTTALTTTDDLTAAAAPSTEQIFVTRA